ncbi:hypothetical protein N7461_001569 [Penicillium sp. DV-2018c]|nr:hypothetical protein N7461_001569 [Penicillium sp. DV-2018c]
MGTLIPWSNFLRSAENAHTTQHWPRRPRTSPYKNSPHTVEVDKVHIGDKHGLHFLTNYHVVRPSKSQSTVHVLESLDQFGSSPARPLNQAIVMEGLARMDRDARLVRLDDRIESMREQHSEISSKLQQAELIGANPHPRLLQWMADYDSHMDSLLHQHAAVKRMPRVMGEAIFVSGKQRRGGRVIDWAFVELSKEAERECFRPNRMSAPAITVHRSQGMSVSDAVLDLSGHEFAAGLSYVAVSRVKSIRGLLFETPFDFDRFKPMHLSMFEMRDADCVRRRHEHVHRHAEYSGHTTVWQPNISDERPYHLRYFGHLQWRQSVLSLGAQYSKRGIHRHEPGI